jgi:hypothetical protein
VRKLALVGAIGAFAIVAPAQADKPAHPPKPAHLAHPTHPAKAPQAKSCAPTHRGLNARGTLVSSTVTKNADGSYSGTLTVNVTKVNHKAASGSQTYTLDHAKVKFHRGVDATAPAAGSRVKVHGKITAMPKKCLRAAGFTPTVTVKKVDVHRPKH